MKGFYTTTATAYKGDCDARNIADANSCGFGFRCRMVLQKNNWCQMIKDEVQLLAEFREYIKILEIENDRLHASIALTKDWCRRAAIESLPQIIDLIMAGKIPTTSEPTKSDNA